jgi:hypothetical protein
MNDPEHHCRTSNLTHFSKSYTTFLWYIVTSFVHSVVASELGTVLGMNPLIFGVLLVSSVLVLCAGAVALAVCFCRSSRHHVRPPHHQSTMQQQPPNASFPCKSDYKITTLNVAMSRSELQHSIHFHVPNDANLFSKMFWWKELFRRRAYLFKILICFKNVYTIVHLC